MNIRITTLLYLNDQLLLLDEQARPLSSHQVVQFSDVAEREAKVLEGGEHASPHQKAQDV